MPDRIGRTQHIAVLGRLRHAVVHAGHAARHGAYPSVALDGSHNLLKEPVEFGLGNHASILAEDATERLRPSDEDRHRPFSSAAAAARLSKHLLVRYKALVWNRPLPSTTNGDARKSKTRTGRKRC